MGQAEKAVACCNGADFCGRKLQVVFQRQANSKLRCAVWVGNLGEFVHLPTLQSWLERRVKCSILSITMGDPSFKDADGQKIVQKLLRLHGGQLVTFETSATNSVQRKALAKFVLPEDAVKACNYFNAQKKVSELGGGRLFLQTICSLKYSAPSSVVHAVRPLVESVLGGVDGTRFSFYVRPDTTSILIHSDDEARIVKLRMDLDLLLNGEVMRDNNCYATIVWNRYTASGQFQIDLTRSIGSDVAFIWCNHRRKEVRVFGDERQCKRLIKAFQELYLKSQTATHAIPISRVDYETILLSGRTLLDKLIRMSGSKSISLDIKSRSLLVEGSEEKVSRINSSVEKLLREAMDTRRLDTLCPVCFCAPTKEEAVGDSVFALACKHSYCRDCFDSWLQGTQTCSFPLVCLAENCESRVSIEDLLKYCPPGPALSAVLREAIDDHIRKHRTH